MVLSVRDVLTWVQFLNVTTSPSHQAPPLTPPLSLPKAFLNGAHLVFLDALGSGAAVGGADMREAACGKLREILEGRGVQLGSSVGEVGRFSCGQDKCGVAPFWIDRG